MLQTSIALLKEDAIEKVVEQKQKPIYLKSTKKCLNIMATTASAYFIIKN